MTRGLFMQVENDPWAFFKDPGSNAKQVMLLIGIVVVVALVFFFWAAYVRTPSSRHPSHRHSDDHGGLPQRRRKRSGLSRLFRRKHRRRRRSSRPERPVNPTLAQIGGLPPHRDEQRPPS